MKTLLITLLLAMALSACSLPVGKEQMSTVEGPGPDSSLGGSTADTVEGAPNCKGVGGP